MQTKIAAKVLKDEDMVEVDAEKQNFVGSFCRNYKKIIERLLN